MKGRPISSTIRRKCIFEESTPTYAAKKDFSLLNSPSRTARFIDNKISKISQLSNINPIEILTSEVTNQLKQLKRHTNSSHIYHTDVKTKLKNFSVDLMNVTDAQKIAANNEVRLKEKVLLLKEEIKKAKLKQSQLVFDQESYLYMKQRLETTQVFLDIKKNEFDSDIKNKDFLLTQIRKTKCMSTERKTRNLRIHNDLNRSLTFFHKEYDKVTQKLQDDMDLMNFIEDKRDMRTTRQLNIIEQVGINESNRKEKETKEDYLIHKFWSFALKKKLENSMNKFSRVDLAFKTIRSITGLDDVSQIVKKLMTKEENFYNLTQLINLNKVKIQKFSKQNSDLQEKIDRIKTLENSIITENYIENLNNQIASLASKETYSKEKLRFATSVLLKVRDWAIKTLQIFDPDFSPKSEKIFELFSILKYKLHSSIKPFSKFPKINRRVFISPNPVNLRNKEKFQTLVESLALSDLNHVETSSSNSKTLIFSDRKRKK